MNMENILSEINRIFADTLERPNLKLKSSDSPLTVEGWDSLNHVRLIAAIESHFSIEFGFKDLAGIATVGDMISLVEKKTNDTTL